MRISLGLMGREPRGKTFPELETAGQGDPEKAPREDWLRELAMSDLTFAEIKKETQRTSI